MTRAADDGAGAAGTEEWRTCTPAADDGAGAAGTEEWRT
jgi:hypothetical protein